MTSPQLDVSRTRLDALEAALEAHNDWLSQGEQKFIRHLNNVRDGQERIMDHLDDVRSKGIDAGDRLTEMESWANETKQGHGVAWWGDGQKSRSFWLLVGATCVIVLCAVLALACIVLGCHRLWLKTKASGWRVYGTSGYQVAERQSSMNLTITNWYVVACGPSEPERSGDAGVATWTVSDSEQVTGQECGHIGGDLGWGSPQGWPGFVSGYGGRVPEDSGQWGETAVCLNNVSPWVQRLLDYLEQQLAQPCAG